MQVDAPADLSVARPHENLRRHVLDGATESVRHISFHDRLLTQTEIREFHVTVGIEENILRF